MNNATFGIRVHSGWAVIVCVSGDPAAPDVVDRRRIVIIDSMMQGAKQPYHFAENLGLEEAERHLQKCAAVSQRLAVQVIREMLNGVTARKYQVLGCAILLASGRELPSLQKILASHALFIQPKESFSAKSLGKHAKAVIFRYWVFASVNWTSRQTRYLERVPPVCGNTSLISERLWGHRGHRTRRPLRSRQRSCPKPMEQVLNRYSRSSLNWLLCRSQHDQRDTDHSEGSHSDQFAASDETKICLHCHDTGMCKDRPCREGDQAAMRRG